MPTDLPTRATVARSGVRIPCVPLRRPRMGFWKAALVLALVARREALNRRMARLAVRLSLRPCARGDARLLAGAQAWLRYTERISALAGIPEPPETVELRAIFHAGPPACGHDREPSPAAVTKD